MQQRELQLIIVHVKPRSLLSALSIFRVLVKFVCIKTPEQLSQLLYESSCILATLQSE